MFDLNTFKHLRNLFVPTLKAAWDITLSANILFVADNSPGLLHRVPLYSLKPMKSWFVGDGQLQLSTLKSGNILVTCYYMSKLIEYTTTGHLVRDINLQQGITNPTHAIQMDDWFLVCQIGNNLHRVSLIDNKGQLTKSYGGAPGSRPGRLTNPYHLVADVNGFCLVVEYGGSSRIILLNDDLELVKELIPESTGLSFPKGLCLDRSRKKLFVADYSKKKKHIQKKKNT